MEDDDDVDMARVKLTIGMVVERRARVRRAAISRCIEDEAKGRPQRATVVLVTVLK